MESENSQLWRGVVHTFAGKYLGELTVRGDSPLECQQRLTDWFNNYFHQADISLTACRLVTRGPEVLLATRHRQPQPQLWPVAGPPAAARPERSVPPSQRYL